MYWGQGGQWVNCHFVWHHDRDCMLNRAVSLVTKIKYNVWQVTNVWWLIVVGWNVIVWDVNFPSELWNVRKTPNSHSSETWYWLWKLWFGLSSACRRKVIMVSYTSSFALAHSLPDQTLTPRGVIDTHWAHLCSSQHNHSSVFVRMLNSRQSRQWGKHIHSSDGVQKYKANTKEKVQSTNQVQENHKHTVRWHLSGNETVPSWVQAQTGDGEGIKAEWPILLSTAFSQTDSRLAEMSSIHHSYLVAAAPQAHPSLFPTPCRRVSSTSSASINLITNRRMDPRPWSTCLLNLPDPLNAFALNIPLPSRAWLKSSLIIWWFTVK